MDALLNINKPTGITSYGVVAAVKRLSGERRVGHAGTLDPDASGVLPVCLGRGTRIIEYLMNDSKTYRARLELGITTDTYDASGRVTSVKDPSGVSRERVESALDSFRGRIEQTPPMYSAIKHHGRPLYELARAGIEVERKSRPAHIHRIETTDWQPPLFTIEVECSKGTYIRSLAHDVGQSLGCGAILRELVRVRSGLFRLEDSVTLSRLECAFHRGYWQQFAYPIDIALREWQAVIVGKAAEEAIKNGDTLPLERPDSPAPAQCRAYNLEGAFIGVLRFDPEKESWRPRKVFL